ncbi:MAG: T9SS type A sorting domain-containing protein, partial [Bacteroidetes bacterium]|nr:T9SS type A sorting domain-containing protein [Bacteroidota bacterium]
GALPLSATAPGTYTVGPFTAGDTVVVTLNNDMNSLCSVHSALLTNPLCPTVIQCGGTPISETYCYLNNDYHEWHWQSSGGQPLALQFSAGTIESNFYDKLVITDGVDINADTLYYNTTGANDLSSILAISTGPDIYMRVTSDGSVSCQSGSQTAWAWQVGCLDCTNPAATYSVVEDCIHHAFSIAVNVDSTGSSSTVRIANTLTNDTLANVPAGITMVGPFPMDSLVSLTVMNATNSLCRVFSPQFTASTTNCVDSVCAAEAFEYCYSNQDTAWFLYQGTANVPLTIQFLWGQMMAGDFVQIFNGSVPSVGALLWQGNLNGNMAGFAINTTNPEHSMLMRVVSNAAGSCATGEVSLPLHWVVQCGAVGVNEVANQDFSMFPNPTTGQLTVRLPDNSRGAMDLRITDLAGRIVHHESFNASGAVNTFDLKNLVSGNYTVTLTTNDWVKSQRLQIIH